MLFTSCCTDTGPSHNMLYTHGRYRLQACCLHPHSYLLFYYYLLYDNDDDDYCYCDCCHFIFWVCSF